MLNNLFGKKKETKTPANTQEKSMQAIQELDVKIQDMEDKISLIDKKANGLQQQAKEKLKAGDKNGAKNVLTKKKKLVEQIKTYEGAMNMMEEQKLMLTNAETMRSVFETIGKTTNVIKDATKGMDVEALEKMKDEMEEMKEVQTEMTEFFGSYAESDDTEVEDEINKLAAEIEEEDLPEATETNKEKDKVIVKPQPVPVAAKAEKKPIAVTTGPTPVKKTDEKTLEDFLN